MVNWLPLLAKGYRAPTANARREAKSAAIALMVVAVNA